MKKIKFSLTAIIICSFSLVAMATTVYFKKALVDFDAYEKLMIDVKKHRATRLVDVNEFLRLSKEKGTVILDTRSDAMYKSKHIKGAIHLDFTDFTAQNLYNIIPDNTTRILIYCNNNFDAEPIYFETKSVSIPRVLVIKNGKPILVDGKTAKRDKKPLTLALNIPTYINLYGYGYKNVYELNELVNTSFDKRIVFEGNAVVKLK
jgi:Rhodanese-like domain